MLHNHTTVYANNHTHNHNTQTHTCNKKECSGFCHYTQCPPRWHFNAFSCRCQPPCLKDKSSCPGPAIFNPKTCKCDFLTTTTTTTTQNLPSTCAELECRFPKQFDAEQCKCVCPSMIAVICTYAQIVDPKDCTCKCPPETLKRRQCNRLQTLNPFTCKCECNTVIPERSLNEKELSRRSGEMTNWPRKRSGSRDSSEYDSRYRRSSGQFRPDVCPYGQVVDPITCQCFTKLI